MLDRATTGPAHGPIPGPGELGHDTWPQDNDAWRFGGAAVWQTPAVDPALDLIYFSTGNPGPDLNGRIRRGDNLFSVSIVRVSSRFRKRVSLTFSTASRASR
jgi:quinohemoprotein ethanol dehydrogenase